MQKEELYKLNLDKQEAEIYWDLLNNGPKTVYKLAQDLKAPRSTMYGQVSTLISKGYLVWSNAKSNKRVVEAVKPMNLTRIIEREISKLEDYKDVIEKLAIYEKNNSKKPFGLNIRYYEGVEGLEQIVWNTLNCKSKHIYGLSDWDRNSMLSPKFIDQHQREVQVRGPLDHIIISEERIKDVQPYLLTYPLEIRTLPSEKLFFGGDTYIYDNIFAATIIREGKVYGFEIENAEFALIQLSMFRLLWSMAKPLILQS